MNIDWSLDYAAKQFNKNKLKKLKKFLEQDSNLIRVQESNASIAWEPDRTGHIPNIYNINRVRYCNNHSHNSLTYDLRIQFIGNGLNLSLMQSFLIEFARKFDIDQYIGNENKRGMPIFIPDFKRNTLEFRIKPRQKIITHKTYSNSYSDTISKQNEKMMQELGITYEQMKQEIELEKQKQREQRNAYALNR